MRRLGWDPRSPGFLLCVVALLVLSVVFARDPVPLDLHVYLVAGSAVFHGHPLYDPAVQVRGYGFTYPPFAALLFALPSTLAAVLASSAMFVLSLVALAVLIRISLRYGPPELTGSWNRWAAALLVPMLIVCEPVRITLWNGQINLILAALIAWDFLDRKHDRIRGVGIGLAAGIKLTPGVFILYLLCTRQWRSAFIAAGTFLGTLAIGYVVLPHDSTRFWLHRVLNSSTTGDTARRGNQSLFATLERAMPGTTLRNAVWVALACLTLAVGLWTAARVESQGKRLLALAVLGTTSCLISPVSWTHHWVWFIPTAIVLLGGLRTGGRASYAFTAVYLTLFVIGCNKPPLATTFRWQLGRAVFGNGYVIAGVAFLAWVAIDAARRSRHNVESERRPTTTHTEHLTGS